MLEGAERPKHLREVWGNRYLPTLRFFVVPLRSIGGAGLLQNDITGVENEKTLDNIPGQTHDK